MDLDTSATPDDLSRLFGFPVPSAFVAVVGAFQALARQRSVAPAALIEELCGISPEGEEARYQQTPPELFPFGWPGVDGVHIGYVLHDPAVVLADPPVGEFCPMDADGVTLLGETTREAFQILLFGDDGAERGAEGNRIASLLGWDPPPKGLSRRYDEEGNGLRIRPRVRPGDRHIMTSDGIGVLAPDRCFRPGSEALALEDSRSEVFDHAKQDLHDGFPATALLRLREGFWRDWTDDGSMQGYGSLMGQAYRALGRPLLADVVRRRTEKYA